MEKSIFDLELQCPWVLFLLIPLALLVFYSLVRREPSVLLPSNPVAPTKNTLLSRIKIYSLIPAIFYALAGIMMIVALAGPRFDTGEIKQRSEGTDIIVAIDLSGSMSAYDPSSRLRGDAEIRAAHSRGETKQRIEVCKEEVRKFIEARPNDRIGLIAFADLPFVVCPPTLDHAWLLKQLNSLSLHTIGDATGIASPIIAAIDRTKDSEADRKVMVLFTDGENTAQNKVTPEQAAQIAKKFSLVIHTVGIGSPRAYIEQEGFFGRKTLVAYHEQFDEKLLKAIAAETGGKYYKASDEAAMREALAEIDKLEKTPAETPRVILHDERAGDVAGLALLFLLIGFFLSRTVFLRYP